MAFNFLEAELDMPGTGMFQSIVDGFVRNAEKVNFYCSGIMLLFQVKYQMNFYRMIIHYLFTEILQRYEQAKLFEPEGIILLEIFRISCTVSEKSDNSVFSLLSDGYQLVESAQKQSLFFFKIGIKAICSSS